MITQKAICLKLNKQTLEDLDMEVALGWAKRNWHINQAVLMYLKVMDERRRIHCLGSKEEKLKAMKDLLEVLVPESRWILLQ